MITLLWCVVAVELLYTFWIVAGELSDRWSYRRGGQADAIIKRRIDAALAKAGPVVASARWYDSERRAA